MHVRTFLLYRLGSDDDRTGVGRQQQGQVGGDSIATGHRHRVTTGHTQPHPFLLCVRVWRWRLVLLERCDVDDRIRVHFCGDHEFLRLCLGGRFGSSSISWRTEGHYLANKSVGHVCGPSGCSNAGKPYTCLQCQDPPCPHNIPRSPQGAVRPRSMGYTMERGAGITPGHRWKIPCTEVPASNEKSQRTTWRDLARDKEGRNWSSNTVTRGGAKQLAWLMSSGPVR